jgi:hypothetical protein
VSRLDGCLFEGFTITAIKHWLDTLAPEIYRTTLIDVRRAKERALILHGGPGLKGQPAGRPVFGVSGCRMPDLKVKVKAHPIWAVVAMVVAFAILALVIVVGA